MLEMSSSILDFFLPVLGVPSNVAPDVVHKGGGFLKVFPQKDFKFVSSRGDGTVAFDPAFVLLSAEEDLFL